MIKLNNSNMNGGVLLFQKGLTNQRLEIGEKELKIIQKYKAYDSVIL